MSHSISLFLSLSLHIYIYIYILKTTHSVPSEGECFPNDLLYTLPVPQSFMDNPLQRARTSQLQRLGTPANYEAPAFARLKMQTRVSKQARQSQLEDHTEIQMGERGQKTHARVFLTIYFTCTIPHRCHNFTIKMSGDPQLHGPCFSKAQNEDNS